MKKRSKILLLILLLLLIAIISIFTYALVTYRSEETNILLKWEGNLGEFINYENGTPVLGSSNAILNPTTDYTNGISTTIKIWKKQEARNFDIFAHIYLDLTTISDALAAEAGLKWAVSSNNILIAEGNFNDYKQAESLPILINQKLLLTETSYTIYIWLDENNIDNLDIEGETLSTLVRAEATSEEYDINNKKLVVTNFDYNNAIQTMNVTESGFYKLEVWGAQGGYGLNETYGGGYGGYATGVVSLNQNDTLYIAVGGAGGNGTTMTTNLNAGGFNGGGNSYGTTSKYVGSGGGATHIATTTGTLSSLSSSKDSILIVAGAGGAGGYESDRYTSTGGSGGGYIGNAGDSTNSSYTKGQGGTQTAGGTGAVKGSFGQGGSATSNGIGGGGGYYGGGSGQYTIGSGGGSGYIANSNLISKNNITKAMYCYNCTTSTDASTLTYTTTNVSETARSKYAKKGNGYARITKLIPYVDTTRLVLTQGTDYNFYNDSCYDVGNGCTIESVTYTNASSMSTGEYQIRYVIKDNSNNKYNYYRKVEIK